MNEVTTATPSPMTAPPLPRSSQTPLPFREDCWSEAATRTLVEAWGDRYLELNRGNLRQKHWQEVADAVNDVHGHIKKARRTDVQCKNRIDTLKKKYKVEKVRVSESNGTFTSSWPFYDRLDMLIGASVQPKKSSPAILPPAFRRSPAAPSPMFALTTPVPVGPRSAKAKRPLALAVDDSYSRRGFSMMAAAAAAAAEEDSESSRSRSRSSTESRRRDEYGDGEATGDGDGGFRQLANAISRFGEIYERVEGAKQKQLVELEKQRMQFAKDLEYQRMKLFMDTQLQLEKLKRTKRSHRDGENRF